MTHHDITALLCQRDPLLQIAMSTHQAAGPKWCRDITGFFDALDDDPVTALGREQASTILTTIANLLISEGITVATGPEHARHVTILSSEGFDTALAASIELLRAVQHRDPVLARELGDQVNDELGAFLAAVQDRIDADTGPQPIA